MQIKTASELVGSAQAAALLNIDRSTLTRWVKSDKLTPALTGSGKTGEMFFTRESVDALIKGESARSAESTIAEAGARGGDAA